KLCKNESLNFELITYSGDSSKIGGLSQSSNGEELRNSSPVTLIIAVWSSSVGLHDDRNHQSGELLASRLRPYRGTLIETFSTRLHLPHL
ncbi:hypothetical protein GIB67_022619, partial [Kingdonia uniflora]